ncbi:hypothetical protein [Clostridium formicaceticum]|uniref:DUF7922 domain-containing protein n=1 Tax=Clostridium formicaceticum TaxID=1497 RepID=A0AAC9RIL7_9CLOT|nr:hypothetical protein [Clostridium formicaceticum]AOY75491.1 hypothetical protein BJL90_06015 [Clostridium formicaceticum]ARE85778.1 hypothetical protein CLFO_00940 [Clostridium formicaceticum]
MKRRYRRYFVMLEEEDKGYSISKSEGTKGYGKIEVRNSSGILSLYCQNLKKLEEKKESYRLYLIQTKATLEPVVVDIGPVKVEGGGKGEIIWEFNAENVKGSKKAIEDFDTLALAVETVEESQRVVVPLVGYIHKEKTNWKSALQKNLFISSEIKSVKRPDEKSLEIQNDIVSMKEKLEEKPKEKSEEKPKEKTRESIKEKSQKEEKPKEENLEKEKLEKEKLEEKKTKEEVPKEKKPREEEQQEKKSLEIKGKETLKESQLEEKPKSPYSFEKDWDAVSKEVHPLQKYIESTLKVFPRVEPFDEKLLDYEWWQIQYNEQTIYRAYLPFISHIEMMSNPYYYHYSYYFSSEYQKQLYRYQHYIFGICYDENKRAKYYVYGIPGKSNITEQPYRGKTGFVYWHPSHYAQFKQAGFGYWLMHIDAETGKVVEVLRSRENQ